MKNLISSFFVALSLYSKIPVPHTEWNEKTMKYALGFLPVIGLFVGGIEYLWLQIAQQYGLQTIFYAAVAMLIPIVITGGIHLDGFVDTTDALSSYGNIEKRLEILKDPHVGAFGVMYLCALMIFQLGIYAQFYAQPIYAANMIFIYAFARTIGGSIIVWLKCAKNSGLARTFADGSNKKVLRVVLFIEAVILLLFMAKISLIFAIIAIVISILTFPFYKRFCYKNFGGITGDLAGFYITTCETVLLIFMSFNTI